MVDARENEAEQVGGTHPCPSDDRWGQRQYHPASPNKDA